MKMHLDEKVWLILSFGMIMGFMLFTGYQTFVLGMGPPSHMETIDPQRVDETAPFDEPGVYQLGENEYEVVMTLQIFSFDPSDIEIPAGATVHFTMTSKDVTHGVQIAGTNMNAMVMPGHVQTITQTFDEPGEYLVLCNEYCGTGHQHMATTITVRNKERGDEEWKQQDNSHLMKTFMKSRPWIREMPLFPKVICSCRLQRF